ncbi:RHS repeat-associated core domain-containing protein [Buttiauxella agrestis]|uniref:Core protein n=1 Tax=Buttiauxella agrestis ATCC 33320 TaxID=1006004 RepID=A0A085G0E5_9ENTR|nr:RHS repeat-associated core domain-containing protein [Buttiauxella agrestis]KFC77190.1 core protein [Buttiauxella agrestis ATCC 33320]
MPDAFITTLTDPAGNRTVTLSHDFIPAPEERHLWPDNRTGQDERYTYRYDKHGNLSEKRRYLSGWTAEEYAPDETHHYHYDQSHRLTQYRREDDSQTSAQGRYVYDPLGRRVGKLTAIVNPVTKQTDTQHSWYGWDGDRLVLSESQGTQHYTIYQPGSFVPLVRVEQMKAEDHHSTLAEKLERDAEVTFPPELHQRLNLIEQELRKNQLSDDTVQFLSATGLKAENLALWLEPEAESDRTIHLYHCDHLGTPLALVNREGHIDWHITLDPWGNVLSEHNPQSLHQPLRMQGQQYDEESGLHYNRHRYYDPQQGRYITQDPIGLAGGINLYNYPLNPITGNDPLGLSTWSNEVGSAFNLPYEGIGAAIDASNGPHYEPISGSISLDGGYSGDVFTGASDAYGFGMTTSEKSPIHMDACVYHTLCEHEGVGIAAGYGGTGTISESPMSTGTGDSVGYMATGGLLGKLTVSGAQDSSGNKSVSLGFGAGEGAFVGKITCNQSTKCLMN